MYIFTRNTTYHNENKLQWPAALARAAALHHVQLAPASIDRVLMLLFLLLAPVAEAAEPSAPPTLFWASTASPGETVVRFSLLNDI